MSNSDNGEPWQSDTMDKPPVPSPVVGPLGPDYNDADARTIKGLLPNFTKILDLAPMGYVAGGCFKNIFNGERPKDIDVFFNDKSGFIEALPNFYAKFNKVYENDNTICFNVDGQKVELIKSQFGTVQEMLDRFDFTVVKFAVYPASDGKMRARYHVQFFEHLMQRKLVLTDTALLPISTFERTLKYTRYGYNMCLGSKQMLIDSIRNSDGGTFANDFYVGID